jgi:hypothetical protein
VARGTEFEITITQCPERTVRPDLHGADAAVEETRDVLVGKILEAMEREHLALLERELGERGAHQHEIVARGGAIGRVGSLVREIVQIRWVAGRGGIGGLAEMIGGHPAGEVVDPGREFSFVAISMPVFKDAEEHELYKVLAGRAMAGQADEKAVERLVMTLEKVAQPVDLAGAYGEHQLVISSFGVFHVSHGTEIFSGWRRRVSTNIWGIGNHGR